MPTVHIIGAGLSGLSAATALAEAHIPVKLYEASASAGGRARSSKDAALGTVDHGLHLLAGNSRETFHFLDRIQSREQLVALKPPYRFTDPVTGREWKISRRWPLPAASLADLAQLARLLLMPGEQTAGELLGEDNPLRGEWARHFARLRLHTPLARVNARALRREFLRRYGRPHMVRNSLRETFVEPALSFLEYCGGSVYFSHTLQRLEFAGELPSVLHFSRKKIALAPGDVVILALPSATAAALLPGLHVPESSHSAITLHFAAAHRQPPGSVRFLSRGMVDLIRYDEGTMRAALRVADGQWGADQPALAAHVWRQLRELHPELAGEELGAWAIWREKRAGHVLDNATAALPAPPRQPKAQCILAGDWLEPARPATIEAACMSGHRAAALARELLGRFPERAQTY